MDVKKINDTVCHLTEIYNTCSPFELCEKMGINILFLDLPNTVEGFFVNSGDQEDKSYLSILINNSVPKSEYERICAHELGHAILHSNINSEKCKDDNEICLESLEAEAEVFSIILLQKNIKIKKGT